MAIVLDGTLGTTTPALTDSALTSGRVTYAGTSGVLQDSANLTFDGTNLSVGTSSPATRLDVNGDITQRNGSGISVGTISNASGWYQLGGTANVNGAQIWSGSAPGAIRFGTGASFTEQMRLDSSGNLGIGATANASAILDAQSTTKGVRMPNMTTTQKNAISSPAAGLMVFDTTLAKLCVYSGSAWQTITSV
jgi:hypothetical protein